MSEARTHALPFVAALGRDLDRAAPAVRDHLRAEGPREYRGRLRSLRRRGGPIGRLLARWLQLANTGDILAPGDETARPFVLCSRVERDAEGVPTTVWTRRMALRRGTVENIGRLRHDPVRACIVDGIGGRRLGLEVELVPSVDDDGAVLMRSGRQWLVLLGWRIRIPGLLGAARTREWQTPEGGIGLGLTVSSPFLLGDYLAYEADFDPA